MILFISNLINIDKYIFINFNKFDKLLYFEKFDKFNKSIKFVFNKLLIYLIISSNFRNNIIFDKFNIFK